MILVDKDIKARVSNGDLIVEGYSIGNVNAISYDLTIDGVVSGQALRKEYDLAPNETVFIQSKEKLSIPNDIMGRVAERNSKMRLGLVVDGPHYYPGHVTKAFLRVHNISSNIITIKEGDKIAQIIFEQLNDTPEHPYQSTFQNEESYMGLGKYETEYTKRIKLVEDAKDSLDKKEQQIYANILTLMGIFVAIFSLISINFNAFSSADVNAKFVVTMNSSLCFCVTVLLGLVFLLLNKPKNKYVTIVYFAVLAILGIITVTFCIV